MSFNMASTPEISPFRTRLLAVMSFSVALAPDMSPFRTRLLAMMSFKTASLPVMPPFKVMLLAVISFRVAPVPVMLPFNVRLFAVMSFIVTRPFVSTTKLPLMMVLPVKFIWSAWMVAFEMSSPASFRVMKKLSSARFTSPVSVTCSANKEAKLEVMTRPALLILVMLPSSSKLTFSTSWFIRSLVWVIADECRSTTPCRLLVALTIPSIFSAVTWKLERCFSSLPSRPAMDEENSARNPRADKSIAEV